MHGGIAWPFAALDQHGHTVHRPFRGVRRHVRLQILCDRFESRTVPTSACQKHTQNDDETGQYAFSGIFFHCFGSIVDCRLSRKIVLHLLDKTGCIFGNDHSSTCNHPLFSCHIHSPMTLGQRPCPKACDSSDRRPPLIIRSMPPYPRANALITFHRLSLPTDRFFGSPSSKHAF